MALSFKCRSCGRKGSACLSLRAEFTHAPWYTDPNGLHHDCVYCRSCGAVHDTVGSLIGPVKRLLGRAPLQVVAAYDFASFEMLLGIDKANWVSPVGLPGCVLTAMTQDGRLSAQGGPVIGAASPASP